MLTFHHPAHGFGAKGEAKFKGPQMDREEIESMQAGSWITFIESLPCARHRGPRGRGRDQSRLLGEDLLVANTDLGYVTRHIGRESHRREISAGGGTSPSPTLAVRVGEYLPFPKLVCTRPKGRPR